MSADDRREVVRLINEWNSSRYELFALSQPNERLEFHGVMRFYFQDAGEKVSTKCIRVDSTASTDDVIKVLIEKFRPDMKSLSSPKDYAIYEVHADAQERKLGPNEHPLWIQLDWGKDGREGRFLLKNENARTVQFDTTGDGLSLLRDKKRLSKREKKKLQKQNKDASKENKINVAEHLYKEVPDSNFTRSISNPEIVMARRRQQKLENKLKQIKNREGGGTLKIYGETLKPDIPYKTLLMSNQDTAAFAVKETLEKYGLPNEEPENYCLVQVVTPSREEREKHGAQIKEYILEDNACPLAILIKHPATSGQVIFQIRRCTPDILALRKQKKKAELEKQQQQQKLQSIQSQPNLQPQQQQQMNNINRNNLQPRPMNALSNQATQSMHHFNSQQFKPTQQQYHNQNELIEANNQLNNQQTQHNSSKLPFLVELNPDGYELQSPRIIQIKSDFYEIGNDKYLASTLPTNYIRLDSNLPGIEKKHCALKKSNDNLQLLIVPFAETYINDRLIKEPTQLFNNYTIRLGKYALFKLENPNELNNMVIANNGNINGNMKAPQATNQPIPIPINKQMNQIPASIPANYGTLYDNGQITETVVTTTVATTGPATVQLINNNNNGSSNTSSISSSANNTAATTSTTNMSQSKPSEGLPGLLEFPDDGEDSLLASICTANQSNWQFKLAPVYTMYMMLRFRLSQKYKSDQMTFSEKLHTVSLLIHKMVNYIREAVDTSHLDKYVLPYWLANSSELLYFLKQDIHLCQISYDAQELLADCVQITFKYLVNIMQLQLDMVLVSFFDPSDHIENDFQNDNDELTTTTMPVDMNAGGISRPTLKHVIQVLNETMNLLRGSRVNAALTIQLFSQLFHYISMWLFNKLVKDQRSGLCSRYWGDKLTRRLNKIQMWAEKQGLELAADCHLSRIIQAAFFLHTPKNDIKDLSTISSNCFALNSLQIKCLLKNYLLAPQESQLSQQLCQNLISIAQNTADEVLKQEGRNLQLEEEVDLQLPFLLPEDGHSSEFIKGLPSGLLDFLEQLQNAGHCWLWQNTQGPGSWKKFMSKDNNQQQQLMPSSSNLNGNTVPAQASTQQHQSQPQTPVTPTASNQFITNNRSNGATSPYRQHTNSTNSNEIQYKPPIAPVQQQQQQQHHQQYQQQQVQSQSAGSPAIVKIKLNKKNNGLGLSIVAARGTNQIHSGIYIKSVVPGGAADDDGRLNTGDQLLAVDDNSLINVTQEKAAELMCKSGPVVILTVAKDAATFHDLDALLNRSPMSNMMQQQPVSHLQQSNPTIAASMPALNNQQVTSHNPQQFAYQQQFQQPSFATATLPRNHVNQTNSYGQNQNFPNQQYPQQNVASEIPIVDQSQPYRARSMSQEVLRNGNMNGNSSPIKSVLKTSQTVQSPPNGHTVVRGLPNEQQIRYGSERPASMMFQHQSSVDSANGRMNPSLPPYTTQRTLPNETQRFGSERPSSAMSSNHSYHQNHHQGFSNGNNRMYNNNSVPSTNDPTSPIRQMQKFRQASLSELDEINYVNRQEQEQQLQQQLMNKNSNNQNNKFDDLYGKVNANRFNQQDQQQQQQQQQYKTLPSRNGMQNMNGMSNDEQTRTKSYGQLYEQIWANNNQQQQQQQRINQEVDELSLRQLDFSNNANSMQPKYDQHTDQTSSSQLRNYENQIVNNNLNGINGTRPPVLNSKPIVPSKPAFVNGSNSNLNKVRQSPHEYMGEMNGNGINGHKQPYSVGSVLSTNNSNIPNKMYTNGNDYQMNGNGNNFNLNWEKEQLNRQREDEEFRLTLLNQRMELMHELESKPYRTNEEENKLNKLRTEIEFDKRVLEMNNMNGGNYLDETNEDNDMVDYSPEVRERLANQMRDELIQRKRVFEQNNLNDNKKIVPQQNNISSNDKEDIKYRNFREQTRLELEELKKRQSEEADRLVEMKREELRLSKHIDLTSLSNGKMQPKQSQSQQFHTSNSNGNLNSYANQNQEDHFNNNNGKVDEIEVVHIQSRDYYSNGDSTNGLSVRPQKHVQFLNDAEIMSPKSASTSSSSNSNGLFKSNTISSDELNSNSSQSPPPPLPVQLPPQIPQQSTVKRVNFIETAKYLDFEQATESNNPYNYNPPTPSVIGANEIYVDKRLKIKQQQQQEQQMANMFIEGEKLSFKDKMKLFAKQSGEIISDNDNKFKVSKKQREIEQKFEIK